MFGIKKQTGRPGRWIAAILFIAGLSFAIATSEAQAAGMLIADGGLGGVLEIKEQTVQVTINNGIAVTKVTQTFQNTENRQVEALYLFPVPKRASVANFSMWIGGKEMVGEVLEKKRARKIYDSYKRVRRDPGLLEQVDYKNFEMRIFPIGPRAEQKVQITYYQELEFDHDWATYVFPLATSPREGINTRTTGKFGLTMQVKSEIPIVSLESPSHGEDFVIVKHTDSYYEASLEKNAGDLNRDVVLAFHVSRPRTGIDVVTSKQPGQDGFFLLTLTAGEELAKADRGMDYVFLLDISGSMAHDGKLRLSRDSIDAFVRELGPEDRFEVITFNVTPNTLFDELRTVSEDSLDDAVQFLRSQQGRGGTVLRPALVTAYKYGHPDRQLNVVILSDGMTEQSEHRELLSVIQSRPANVRVFCIGVGNDVNRPLLSQLADDAGGLSAFLSRGDNFTRQAKAFRRKLTRPAAGNVQIRFDGADVYDVHPRKLPNLYHGMPLRLYGRYRNGGPVDIHVEADVNGAAFDQTVSVEFPASDPTNSEIERMWAWQKIDRLLKEANRSGSKTAAIDEIVRLGEGYSIVTEYTSFLVLENDAEYRRWKIDRRNLLRLARDRKGQQAVQAQLARLREQAMAKLGPNSNSPGFSKPKTLPTLPVSSPDVSRSPLPNVPAPVATRSSRDLDFRPSRPGGGGGGGAFGGAFDPISGGIVLTLAGLGYAARRRKRSTGRNGKEQRAQ